MAGSDLLSIAGGFEARLVGGGAANVVFEILVPDSSSAKTVMSGNLLRVPKAGTGAFPHQETQEYWEASIKPILDDNDLVKQRLVRFEGTDLVTKLNAVLSQSNKVRRADYRESLVADVRVGMLVEDMRKQLAGDIVLEFKPKWLAQSPNAPASARRCRNCAREAYRNNKNGTRDPILCPLDLLECGRDKAALQRVLGHMVAAKDLGGAGHARLVDWLCTNTLLRRLRDAQIQNDPNGPLEATTYDPQLQLAMTLRDCTCFVRIPADTDLPVEAKLADLDKKNWEVKVEYWQSTERKLADGGYYHGREEPLQTTACQIERQK